MGIQLKSLYFIFNSIISILFITILVVMGLVATLVSPAVAATQIDIPGPEGSGAFGTTVNVLPNGNFIVIDPQYDDGDIADVGAVYLYDGASGELISALTGSTSGDQVGSGGVTLLTNGNFVVCSPAWANGRAFTAGAVTWGDGTNGVMGSVSASNSLVGSIPDDRVCSNGITALANGNYVVISTHWDNVLVVDAGAVTWGSGATGITGPVSVANSLVGSANDDWVGTDGVLALDNGNYLVRSHFWDSGGVTDLGAVTWGDGTTGVAGAVSAANSLVGSTTEDYVGAGVTTLTNSNYVVHSHYWDNGGTTNAGAVTWGDGTTGATGMISAANSLVGSHAEDQVGTGVTALTNSNYVVRSPLWDNGTLENAGAATWGDGSTGVTGAVSPANSLVGSTAGDGISSGVTALTNGNYVVSSPSWDNGAVSKAGAVTWGDGTSGVTGAVSPANSLVGSTFWDRVGSNWVTALTNGNYVVSSPFWNNGSAGSAGAVTWGDGTSGITGTVSAANSMVGSTDDDQVGYRGVTALANGNYVVSSPNWDDGAVENTGAATWGDGTSGITGAVSAANSLVGSTAYDYVGISGVDALTNGNYVVNSSAWNNGGVAGAGAVTWGDGTSGVTGTVNAANSLVGSTYLDQVGNFGVEALANDNYVVYSPYWDNDAVTDAGASTWGDGTNGSTGVVSPANSLVGSSAYDKVGEWEVTALADGSYVVYSPNWDNDAVIDAGAVSWGYINFVTTGPLTADNSVRGTTTDGGFSLNFAYDDVNQQLVVGRPYDNIVTLFRPNRVPVADAGPDQTVEIGTNVTLDGSASYDPDGDLLAFDWVQSGGTTVMLSGSNTSNPTFTAPAVTQTSVLTFTLVVSDTQGLSSPADEVIITVEPYFKLLPIVLNQ